MPINVKENRRGNQDWNGQSRDTGNCGPTRHRTHTKQNKNEIHTQEQKTTTKERKKQTKQSTTQKIKIIRATHPTKIRG
jgi:hypothetical protein